MSLILKISRSQHHRVIRKHRCKLAAAAAKSPGHRRIQIGAGHIRRIELINGLGLVLQGRVKQQPIRLHSRQKIALKRKAAHQPRRIPPEGRTVGLRIPHRRRNGHILTDIEENHLPAAGIPNRLYQRINILDRPMRRMMMRLIDRLNYHNRRLVLVSPTGITVDMVDNPRQIALLSRNRLRIQPQFLFGIKPRKSLP